MKKVFSITILTIMLVGILAGCWLGVPTPEVKEGEFDLSVTYEFKGETKTVSCVYVCEYDGVTWALDGGAHRDWTGYIKDGKTEELIELGTTADGNEITLSLRLYPEHFMGDPVTGGVEPPAPFLSVTVNTEEGFYFLQEPEEIEKLYGAKILNYKYEEPINNTFN